MRERKRRHRALARAASDNAQLNFSRDGPRWHGKAWPCPHCRRQRRVPPRRRRATTPRHRPSWSTPWVPPAPVLQLGDGELAPSQLAQLLGRQLLRGLDISDGDAQSLRDDLQSGAQAGFAADHRDRERGSLRFRQVLEGRLARAVDRRCRRLDARERQLTRRRQLICIPCVHGTPPLGLRLTKPVFLAPSPSRPASRPKLTGVPARHARIQCFVTALSAM